jgi:hypothetical protein
MEPETHKPQRGAESQFQTGKNTALQLALSHLF